MPFRRKKARMRSEEEREEIAAKARKGRSTALTIEGVEALKTLLVLTLDRGTHVREVSVNFLKPTGMIPVEVWVGDQKIEEYVGHYSSIKLPYMDKAHNFEVLIGQTENTAEAVTVTYTK